MPCFKTWIRETEDYPFADHTAYVFAPSKEAADVYFSAAYAPAGHDEVQPEPWLAVVPMPVPEWQPGEPLPVTAIRKHHR